MIIENITMSDFSRHLRKKKTIIFPFGTVEEHGKHLPLNTDTLIIHELLKRVIMKRKVFLAPPVYYGVCTTTKKHPGTISITPETLRRLTADLISAAYGKGLRNFILISGHGGGIHMSALKEVAEGIIENLNGVKIAVLSPYDILFKELAEIADTPNDSHAGELETSLVLYLAPELVKGRSKEEYPKFPRPLIVKNKVKYWKGGVWGNPGLASKEKGKRAAHMIIQKIIEVIDMIEKGKSGKK
jgi:creatinine amidohydrolase